MKRFFTFAFALITAAVLLAPARLNAADATTTKKKHTYDKVTAVDATASTVTISINDKGDTKQYSLDKFTVIMVNGKNGKLADVQSDMRADVTVKTDGKTLSKLDVSDPPVEKEKKTKK